MPDLNSVPHSPHVLARRPSSQQMPPPPVPSSPSLNILPSNQSAVNNMPSSSSQTSPHFTASASMSSIGSGDNSAVGSGPGPVRHPRPMNAADLHLELEKEQEAVVNRLTRELSILRAAQNASVVSNASSTSASVSGGESLHLGDPQLLNAGVGPGFSHQRHAHHQRTASNASTRSLTAHAGSVSTTSISSPAPIRPTQQIIGAISLSRQNSSTSRRSRAGSPSPGAGAPAAAPQPYHYPSSHSQTPSGSQAQTPSHSYTHSHLNEYFAQRQQQHAAASNHSLTSAPLATPGSSEAQMSPSLMPATSRYEETAFYRAELDSAKRENDALKRRVRELERMVRDRRASDASRASAAGVVGAGTPQPRTRSESVSTTASVSVAASATGGGGAGIAAQRESSSGAGVGAGSRADRPRVVSMLSTTGSVGVGVPEEELKVGESAASLREEEEGKPQS